MMETVGLPGENIVLWASTEGFNQESDVILTDFYFSNV